MIIDIYKIVDYQISNGKQRKDGIENTYECNDNPNGCQDGSECVVYCDYGGDSEVEYDLYHNIRHYFQSIDQ